VSGDEAEAARALPDALDLLAAMDLGEERRNRVVAANAMARGCQ
jgi:hypothetical protein